MIPKKYSASARLDGTRLRDALRARGLRLTRPRRVILEGVRATDAHPSDEERGKISAVHFVRFAVPAAARRDFEQREVALVVDHPNERARTVLTPETKRSLAADLA